METVQIILVKDHSALGKEGAIVNMPEANVKAWEDSGYATIHKGGKKATKESSKDDSKEA